MFCLLMAPEVYNPLRQFAAHYHDRANARAAVAEMHQLFGRLSADFTAPTAAHRETTECTTIEADALSTAPDSADHDIALSATALNIPIPGREQLLIKDLSFTLKKGQSIAIMGASGIGKSSLLETLAALRPADGSINLAGLPLSSWSKAQLRQHLMLIGQYPYVFAGSIADNLRLASAQADDKALAQAVQLAAMEDVIAELPAGLNSTIATRGYGLSGGQLQRLALARLFLANPSVILLDEPTSNLDASTRDTVLDNLMHFAKGRSLLMVTHDPMVALRADSVFCLQDQTLVPLDKRRLLQEMHL